MATYNDIRPKLQTGDIVLFSGKSAISTTIKLITGSIWSHVGMVLNISDWDTILLWESTTLSDIADIETGKERKGVQLVPLSDRIQKYKGDVCIRLLEIERTEQMLRNLSSLRNKLKGRPYEEDKIELLKSAYDGPFGANREDLSSLFCSEMVAEAYQSMGLLSESLPSNEYTPKDFTEKGNLSFINGSLSKQIEITAA